MGCRAGKDIRDAPPGAYRLSQRPNRPATSPPAWAAPCSFTPIRDDGDDGGARHRSVSDGGVGPHLRLRPGRYERLYRRHQPGARYRLQPIPQHHKARRYRAGRSRLSRPSTYPHRTRFGEVSAANSDRSGLAVLAPETSKPARILRVQRCAPYNLPFERRV